MFTADKNETDSKISSSAIVTEVPRNEDIERGAGEHLGIGVRESGHGLIYHLKLCILCFIRAMHLSESGCTFGLTAEHKLLNPFDDIVLMLKTQNDKHYYLIQAKHGLGQLEKEIVAKDFLKEKFNNWGNQFTLQKYFKGYCQVRKMPEFESAQMKFVVCTNISMDFEDMKRFCISVRPCSDQYFSVILKESEGKCYKFSSKGKSVIYKALKSKSDVSDDDINSFLDEFVLAVNLPNVDDLTNIIKKEIGTMFNCINTDLMSSEFQERLLEWLKRRTGTWLTQDEGENTAKEILDTINSLGAKGLDITHQLREVEAQIVEDCLVDTIRKIAVFFKSDDDFLQVVSEPKTSYLSFLKIYQVLEKMKKEQKCQIAHDNGIIFTQFKSFSSKEMRQYFQSALNSERYKLLIVYSREKDKVSRNIYRYLNKVIEIINKRRKKILIITEKKIDLSELEEEIPDLKCRLEDDDGFTFIQLNETSKSKLINKQLVIFQGNEEKTSLASLTSDRSSTSIIALADIEEIIDQDTLVRLIKNKDIQIGKLAEQTPVLSDIYQSRKLVDETTGCIMTEDDLLKDGSRVIIINEEAGTGKSTLMNSFSRKHKKNYPFHWICRINLNNHSEILHSELNLREKGEGSFDQSKTKETLEFLVDRLLESRSSTKLETPFEKQLFKLSMMGCINTIFLFDGFDEICPDYKEIVMDLLYTFLETKISKLYITSRLKGNRRMIELPGAKYLKTTPLTEEDQVSFLMEYWTRAIGIEDEQGHEKLKEITHQSRRNADQSMLTNPLTLLMTAEYWRDSISSVYKSLNSCFEKIDYEVAISSRLPSRLSYIELFNYYICGKFKIYQMDKSMQNDGNISSNNKHTFFVRAIQKVHSQLALSAIFGQDTAGKLQGEEPLDDTIKVELPKIGLVHRQEREFHFVHKSFAEHFVIDYLHINPTNARTVLNTDSWEAFMQRMPYSRWDEIMEYIIQGWFDIHLQKWNRDDFNRLKYILTYIALVRNFRHQITKEITEDEGPYIDEDMKKKLLSIGLLEEAQPKSRIWRGYRFIYWRFGEHFVKDYIDRNRHKALTVSKYWRADRMERYFKL